MSSNYFDHIEQALTLLQEYMAALQTENDELRRQVDLLRQGQQIYLEIFGQRLSLLTPPTTLEQLPLTSSLPSTPIPSEIPYAATPLLKNTPALDLHEVEDVEDAMEEELHPQPTPTPFLEEILLDEFAAAATSPMAVWTGPLKKQEQIDEDQKATLRRELMGSFLLE